MLIIYALIATKVVDEAQQTICCNCCWDKHAISYGINVMQVYPCNWFANLNSDILCFTIK